MKYIFIDSKRIIPVTERYMKMKKSYIFANEEDKEEVIGKDLVIEEQPDGDYEAYFENGEVITKKWRLKESE